MENIQAHSMKNQERTKLYMRRLLILVISVFFMLHIGIVPSHADTSLEDTLFTMSLDELLKMEIVTAAKIPESLSRSTSNVFVITESDLKRIGARSINDALQLVPGVTVGKREFGENTITMRGVLVFDTPGVLYLLNGHVLNAARTGSAPNQFLDHLPVENIERIEVIKGPGSALFGANAFMGIVNIITKSADDMTGLELDANLEFEEGNNIGPSFNILYGRKFDNNTDLLINMNYVDQNGPVLDVDADAVGRAGEANTGRKRLDFQTQINIGDFHLQARYFDRESEGYFGLSGVLADGSELTSKGGFIEADWQLMVGDDIELKPLVYVDHISLDNMLKLDSGGLVSGNIKIDETYVGSELQVIYRGIKNHVQVMGVGWRRERQHNPKFFSNISSPGGPLVDLSNTMNWIDEAERDILYGFIENVWDIYADFRLTAGVRYDNYSDFGSTTNPRIGALWQISDKFALKINYGSAYRAPDFGSQFVKNNPAITGNPNLDHEEIDTYEITLSYQKSELYWGSITYFHSELEELIQISNKEFENIGSVRIDGVEVDCRYHFKSNGYIRGYYTFTESELTNGDSFPNVADHTAGLELNLRLTEKLNWNLNGYWQNKLNREAGDPRSDMDAYTVLNTTLLVKKIRKGLELQFSIFNLFNENFMYPSAPDSIPGDFPAPGRSFILGASYRF